MLGDINGDTKDVRELIRAENSREEGARHNRFEITPQDFMASEKAARERGMKVLGFYHSHPNAPARPSEFDREHAWPWYSYIIVSVQEGGAADMTSWVLRDDRTQFDSEELNVQAGPEA